MTESDKVKHNFNSELCDCFDIFKVYLKISGTNKTKKQ